jgi:hypothetical protein
MKSQKDERWEKHVCCSDRELANEAARNAGFEWTDEPREGKVIEYLYSGRCTVHSLPAFCMSRQDCKLERDIDEDVEVSVVILGSGFVVHVMDDCGNPKGARTVAEKLASELRKHTTGKVEVET